jgi:pimeloyl-[acyl-carrier protein] methyl ester esterase
LFIPPLGLTWQVFANQIKAFSSEYNLIVINLPGFGLSKLIDDLSPENLCRNIIGAVDALDIDEPVHLIAGSFGGFVAQVLAAKFPERIASLTLISSFYELLNLESHLADTPYEDEIEFLDNLFDIEMEHLIKTNVFDKRRVNLEKLSAFYKKCVDKGTGVGLKYGQFFSEVSNLELLHHIKCPTLVINGKYDLLKLEEISKEIHSRIPNSNLCELYTGHFSVLTHPDELNDLVLTFLRGLDSKKSKVVS